METLAPALYAETHIPYAPTPPQRWSDAKTHLESPMPSGVNAERAPLTISSRETSPSRIANPSHLHSPNRSHKKSSSIPSPVVVRKGHVRKLSGIPKSPSVPTFHHHSASADAAPLPSSLHRAPSNKSVTRSPSRKKGPAYHSSYGVETELGPPPSYSTQRTLSQDRVWRVDSRSEVATDEDTYRHSQFSESRLVPNEPASNLRPGDATTGISPGELVSSPETLDTPSIDTPVEEQTITMAKAMASYGITIHEDGHDTPLREQGVGHVEDPSGSSSDERKSEDLFLNIARNEAAAPTDRSKTERQRSRVSLPFLSNTRPSSSRGRDSAEPFDPSLLTPKMEVAHSYNHRSSPGWHSTTASNALDSSAPNSARSRYYTAQPRKLPNIATSTISRDARPRSPEDTSVKRRYSGLNGQLGGGAASRTQRYVSDSNALYAPKLTAPTESTISTTAPSTVWDELDDLKSRIKKLELTGKLPSSSAAAMSSIERPRTATTTVTTMSSSPQYNKNIAHLQSAIEGVPSTLHPLLHEALSNAQGVVSNEVYRKLQATALDALQLTSMLGGGGQGSSAAVMGIPPSAERQIRRRADDMCRNLTELAIALSVEPRSAVSPTPAIREIAPPSLAPPRSMSNEPADRAAIMSRAQSRIESRRASLRLGESRFGFSSPVEAHTQTPPSVVSQTQSASRVQRTATTLRGLRAHGYDGAADEEDRSAIRPVSRARTDIGRSRALRDPTDFSREYTSLHPMPAPPHYEPRAPRPPSSSSIPLMRRKYTSPASVMGENEVASSPITPAPRERFGRISVVNRQSSVPVSSPLEGTTPENITVQRGSGGGRRSMGLAGRIGSTVGSRLRAVRAERMNSGARRESDVQQMRDDKAHLRSEENRLEDEGQQLMFESASVV